jgi:hypothetical protein
MIWDELLPIATDWAEVFYGVIPVEKLNDSYLAAKQNPDRKPEDRKFPLKDTEILDAFYKLRAGAGRAVAGCAYCRFYAADPTEYPPCPFHKPTTTQKGLQL